MHAVTRWDACCGARQSGGDGAAVKTAAVADKGGKSTLKNAIKEKFLIGGDHVLDLILEHLNSAAAAAAEAAAVEKQSAALKQKDQVCVE